MTHEMEQAITKQAEKLFYHYCHHNDADLFCAESCPFKTLCDEQRMWWGCGVWEELMGEDL